MYTSGTELTVLANDLNGPLRAQLVDDAVHGALQFYSDGGFTYEPPDDFIGRDRFTYRAFGAQGSSSVATATITVRSRNDEPTIVQGPEVRAVEDVPFVAKNWATVSPGSSPDESRQRVWSVIDSNPSPELFAIPPTIDKAGTLRFTPAPDATGTAYVWFHLEDDGGRENAGSNRSRSESVKITIANVPDKPVGAGDAFTVTQGRTLAQTDVLWNDVDVDGDPLTAVLMSGTRHGQLDFKSNGTFTYTPHSGFLGRDHFTYRPRDASQSGNATTVTIDVVPPPPPPTGSISGSVFDDRDGDGVWEAGERGVAGHTVFVDANRNGVRDDNEKAAVTNADGRYQFEKLPLTTYRLAQVIPAGWRATWPMGEYHEVELLTPAALLNRNFAQTDRARIAGAVFMDANVDGAFAAAEAGLPGWRVFIDGDGNGLLDMGEQSVVTDSRGRYAYDDLAPGAYSVRVATSPNYYATIPFSGARSVTVDAGESIGGRNFGQKRIVRGRAPVLPPAPTPLPADAGGLELVKNINQTPMGTGAIPLLSVNNRLVLEIVGNNKQHGLFATDGVQTVLLMEGGVGDFGKPSAVAGSVGYFTFYSRIHGRWQLWRTDGTPAGTALVRNIGTKDTTGDIVEQMVAVGDRVVFSVHNGGGVWGSDGTEAGTSLLNMTAYQGITVAGERAYLIHAGTFWSTDGTIAGTKKLGGWATSQPHSDQFDMEGLEPFGDAVMFANRVKIAFSDNVLGMFDGASARTVLGVDGNPVMDVRTMMAAGATLFVDALQDGRRGLWATDRTFTQWRLVGDDGAYCLGTVGNSVIFAQHNGLWSSDGVLTHKLPKYTGLLGSDVWPVNVGRRLMLAAGSDVWVTDGTADGTVVLAHGTHPAFSPFNQQLFDVNGLPYFMMNGRLWSSDGTPGGTQPVTTLIQSQDAGSAPSDFTAVGDAVYFVANDGIHGRELWRSDAGGTRLVRDIALAGSTAAPARLTAVNGRLVFTADDGTHGRQLWTSDGTAGGTMRISSFTQFAENFTPGPPLVRLGNYVYFAAGDAANGRELWRSDGTAGGTTLVANIRKLNGSSSPRNLTVMGDHLYFSAAATGEDFELWRSDGTAAGTTRVHDLRPGLDGSGPQRLTASGRTLFFIADDGTDGRELWRTDGTSAGTVLVADLNPSPTTNDGGTTISTMIAGAAGRVVFTATTSSSRFGGVWVSDGTRAGTFELLPASHLAYQEFVRTDSGLVYFVHGSYSIWRTDGTPAGTLQASIDESSFGSSPQKLTAVGNVVYFTAHTSGTGRELWLADGRGLSLVADLSPGYNASNPTELAAVNHSLMFAADDGFHASEPWRLDVPRVGTIAGSVFNDLNADGARSEGGALGFRVFVDADNDGVWDKSERYAFSSGDNGWFEIPELSAGNHWLRISEGNGWRATTSIGHRVAVDAGNTLIRHFGVTRNVLITGAVFMDANWSGHRDAAEDGIPLWTVFVDADGDGELDDEEYSVLTDSAGQYAIRTLAGDNHRIRVVESANYRRTAPAAGYRDLMLMPGEIVTGVNFGQKRFFLKR